MSLTAHLERMHPEPEYKDGLDAFSRLMAVANIKTQSDARQGYQADEMDAFSRDENHGRSSRSGPGATGARAPISVRAPVALV